MTKPRLAKEIIADMVADRTMPPWFAGDEVYGRSRELRGGVEREVTLAVANVGTAANFIRAGPGIGVARLSRVPHSGTSNSAFGHPPPLAGPPERSTRRAHHCATRYERLMSGNLIIRPAASRRDR